jgi:hypothetical protein
VRIRLSTGETEVLVTSLLDSEKYTTQMLKELYHLRWGIETPRCVLKERPDEGGITLQVKQSLLLST